MDSMYLDNLDEFINDENKIVTYRWLSLTLNVSSNASKQMLFHFYDKSKNSDRECKLSATYLLSGLLYDEELKQDVHKVCVIQDDELEEQKSRFKVIYSLHIYSLQKVKLKDLHILYGIDYDKIKEDIFKSVEYSSISPSSELRSNLKSKHEISISSPKKASPKKNAVSNKTEVNDIDNKENNLKEKATIQKDTSKNVKGSLQSMFANQAKKTEVKKPLEVKQETNIKSSSNTSSEGTKKKGSLDAFFSKGPKTQSPTEGVRRSPRKKQDENMEVDNNEEEKSPRKKHDEKMETDIKAGEKSTNKTQEGKCEADVQEEIDSDFKDETKRETRSSPRKNVKMIAKVAPKPSLKKSKRKSASMDLKSNKRQRIMTLADSSSESSSEEEEENVLDESPMPSPPAKTLESDDDESPFPPTPKPLESEEEQKRQGNKRRKKKQVDKTYEDEEGFLVTVKEYEFVTDSEDEDPLPTSNTLRSSPKATNICSPKKEVSQSNRSEKGSPKKEVSPSNRSPGKVSPKKKKRGRSSQNGSPQKKNKKSSTNVKQSSITSFFKPKN